MATNVNVTEPPEFLRSYYAAMANRGMELGNLPFQAYQQPRVAPWNQQQEQAANMVQQRALQGSPAMDTAGNYFQNVVSGGMLNNNPYLNNQIGQAQDNVTSRINSQFNNNAFGGTAHQQTLARELGNIDTNMRGQNYQFERGMQQNALGFAPTLAANDYADAQALMGVGNQVQGHNQNIANANYQEFIRQQGWPGQQLAYMQGGLSPSASAFRNSTTTESAPEGSPLVSALGGGMAGYGLTNAWNGLDTGYNLNPWIGAGIGGLLSFL